MQKNGAAFSESIGVPQPWAAAVAQEVVAHDFKVWRRIHRGNARGRAGVLGMPSRPSRIVLRAQTDAPHRLGFGLFQAALVADDKVALGVLLEDEAARLKAN